ncbi:MAG: OmpH family outer membrane protein [Bacteroidetes bacterium]|nr:OmpH family outer membrane protein [Bacteroidota bacterium]MCL1968815.1 OmpH family outer membrane protein [Bacteroidota bacterium]
MFKIQKSNHLIHTSSNHLIIISAFCFLFSAFSFFSGSAQSKFGHADYTGILSNMSGIDSIQKVLANYVADLQTIGEQMEKEFVEKQTALEQMVNAGNTSQAILKIKEDELKAMYKRIMDFKQSADADIQDKQVELLEPYQNKLSDAIKKVAKANNYNYVFDISVLLFYAPGDDLTNKVKAELDIK